MKFNETSYSLKIKAPTVVNIELTELCNVKCKHCYNPWRDETMGNFSLDILKLKKIIKKLSEHGVFHVVLSGGEPLSNYEVLREALKILNEKNISYSCNTNLILADDQKMSELSKLGLDHCLTSIPSIDPSENDEIMQSKGSLAKILEGIKCCIRNNIKVSANMVVTKSNKHRVYETGKLMAELGCSKFFVTRAVPPVYSSVAKANNQIESDLVMSKEEVKKSLEDAIRVKQEYGIAIGSLISYPLCFLGDLKKFEDFVGRGCPSQRGHIVNINASGQLHTCVHEEETYGNIFINDLEEIYQKKMEKWRNGSLHYKGCKGCEYLNVCHSGCQMTANAVNGELASRDPLFVGPDGITEGFNLVKDKKIYDYLDSNGKFYVPKRVRFRDDKEIYLINARWGNTITAPHIIGEFLKKQQNENKTFSLNDAGKDKRDWIVNLYYKDIIESTEKLDLDKTIIGLSADLMYLPSIEKIDEKKKIQSN